MDLHYGQARVVEVNAARSLSSEIHDRRFPRRGFRYVSDPEPNALFQRGTRPYPVQVVMPIARAARSWHLPPSPLTYFTIHSRILGSLTFLAAGLAPVHAQTALPTNAESSHAFHVSADGVLIGADANGTYTWDRWEDYLASDFFTRHGKSCGTAPRDASGSAAESQADCSTTNTTPAAQYAPAAGEVYEIPVVVHVLIHNNGSGDIPDSRILSQIQVLNQDFASATDAAITFTLAGITRTVNRKWFNDQQAYYNSLAWDTTEYLNIYTNTAGGNLGYAYVPNGGGVVGNTWDGVRINYNAMGVNPAYSPYDLGRTATHEVGHYLGLYHTFDGGCHGGNCNQAGDLICDTAPEASPNYNSCGFGSRNTCSGGDADPINNYMDYSNDACMDRFSAEQVNRMRCTIQNFRVDLPASGPSAPGLASSPSPVDGANNVAATTGLTWTAGTSATASSVYLGLNANLSGADFLATTAATSIDPGSLLEGATYYWRVDSSNSVGTTTGDTWSFVTSSTPPPPGGDDLFYDGFESGSFDNGLWATSGSTSVSGAAAITGSLGAQIRRDGWIEFQVSTAGLTTAELSFEYYVQNLDPSDSFEVIVNGSATALSNGATNSNGTGVMIDLPLGTLVTVRFLLDANKNNERARIDEVRVTGE